MVNTANTAWKLTDLWNTALFTFDMTNGYHPNNENQAPEITGEDYNIPWMDVVNHLDYGLGGRQITLQGIELDDKDVWLLSSAICKRQLMKLWVGDDWFYYVLGIEPRQSRDQSLPGKKSYNISFKAMDPHLYHANSPGGSGTGKSLVVPQVRGETSGRIDVFLTDTSANQPTTYVEPAFWIIGGSSTNVTSIIVTDQWGRKLTYTPTSAITDGDEHVIMPWRNSAHEGYVTMDATGFKLTDAGKTATIAPSGPFYPAVAGDNPWDVFNNGAGTDDSITATSNAYAFIEEEIPVILSRNGTSFIEKNRNYPRCYLGLDTALGVSYTGTSTDISMYACWMWRRI